MRKAIIWDFDGVLVLTPHEKAWKLACQKLGIKGFTSSFYADHVSGKPRMEGALEILERLGGYHRDFILKTRKGRSLLEKLAYEKNSIYNRLISEGEYRPNEDALLFLLKARSYGIVQVLASASKNTVKLMDRISFKGEKLSGMFDYNFSGFYESKDDIIGYAVSHLEDMGIRRKCIILIEDSYTGIKAGNREGIKTICYRCRGSEEIDAYGRVDRLSNVDPQGLFDLLGC